MRKYLLRLGIANKLALAVLVAGLPGLAALVLVGQAAGVSWLVVGGVYLAGMLLCALAAWLTGRSLSTALLRAVPFEPPEDKTAASEVGRVRLAFNRQANQAQEWGAAAGGLFTRLYPGQQLPGSPYECITAVDHKVQALEMELNEQAQQLKQTCLALKEAQQSSADCTGEFLHSLEQLLASNSSLLDSVQTGRESAAYSEQQCRLLLGSHQRQESAVAQLGERSGELQDEVRQTTSRLEETLADGQRSRDAAHQGSQLIEQTIRGMDRVRTQVEQMTQKVNAMGRGSEDIGIIVDTIEEIAGQTNLLAINATIEAAHAGSQATQLTETLLDRFMVGQARLIATLIQMGLEDQPPTFWRDLAKHINVDSIFVTDADGVTRLTSDTELLGWRFPDDPNAQTYVFRQLIHQKDGVVCQPPQRRSADNQVFKYVGVSRKDQPGIVQVGFNTSSLARFALQIGGFAVVAGEVYQLADRAKAATVEIRGLIKRIQSNAGEAVSSMQGSAGEVEKSLKLACEVGSALQLTLESAQRIHQGVSQAAAQLHSAQAGFGQLEAAVQAAVAELQSSGQARQALARHTEVWSTLLGQLELAGSQQARQIDQLSSRLADLERSVSTVEVSPERLLAV